MRALVVAMLAACSACSSCAPQAVAPQPGSDASLVTYTCPGGWTCQDGNQAEAGTCLRYGCVLVGVGVGDR